MDTVVRIILPLVQQTCTCYERSLRGMSIVQERGTSMSRETELFPPEQKGHYYSNTTTTPSKNLRQLQKKIHTKPYI